MLETLSIENFRTFREQETLVFKTDFSAIIGPNGSGKTSSIAALRLLYENGECGADTAVIAAFDGVKFEMRDKKCVIDGQLVGIEEFRSRLPKLVFPDEEVLEQPFQQSSEGTIEQLKSDFKRATDQLSQQKRALAQLKEIAEAAQRHVQLRKEAESVEEQYICSQLQGKLEVIEAKDLEIAGEDEKLSQIPVSEELHRAQALLNDIETEILKVSFQKEQNQGDAAALQPRIGKLQAQIEQLDSKIQIIENSIRQFAAKQEENVVLAAQTTAKLNDLEFEAAKMASESQIELPADFLTIKARFEDEHAAEISARKSLREKAGLAAEGAENAKIGAKKAAEESAQNEAKIAQIRREMQVLQGEKSGVEAEIGSNKRIVLESRRTCQDCDRKIANLQARLEECAGKITRITQNSKMMQQQQRYQKNKQEFKQQFGQRFHGSLRDLMVAANPEYEAALSFATAGLKNAFVVDDFITAQTAIQQLRQMREAPQSFIVLNQLQEPTTHHENALVDAVRRVPQYDKLFAYACRNTVLLDDSAAARALAKQTGARVVTKDCKLFLPSGMLQAEIGATANAGGELNYSRLGELQAEKAELDQKLSEQKSKRQACELQIEELEQQDVLELDFRLRELQQKLDLTQIELIRLTEREEETVIEIDGYTSRKNELEAVCEELEAALEEQTELIDELKLTFYAPVIKALGISNQEFLRVETQSGSNTALAIQKQIIAEQERLRVLEQGEYQADIDRFSLQGQQLQQEAQKARKDLSVLTMRLEELEIEIKEEQSRISELKLEGERNRQAISLSLRQQSSQADEMQQIQQHLANMREERLSAQYELTQTLEMAYTEEIPIPSDEENPRQLLEAFVSVRSDPVAFLRHTYKVDLQFLTEEGGVSPAQRSAELHAKLLELQSQLAENVDLGAITKLEEERVKLQTLFNEHQVKKEAYMAAVRAHTLAEEENLQAYEEFIQKIESAANEIYKAFTDGMGSISITSDAVNEYQIIAIPPGDGSRQLESLSGGEQALVRCSIQLAYCITHGAKTIIFDEIDANLDGEKVGETSAQLKRIADEHSLRIIVITHKPDFCKHCGCLCGVAKRENEGARSWWIWG